MTSSVRQTFVSDPTPSNLGDIAGNRFVAVSNTDTVSGNTLWCVCCIANFASNVITGVSDSVNGPWTKLDQLDARSVGVNDALSIASYYLPNAASLPAGFKGTASGGSTTTIVCTGAGWTTNQWAGKPVLNLSNGDTVRTVLSNTNDTLTLTATAFSTSNGNLFAVGGWVEIDVSGFDDYDAAFVAEIQGVGSSPLLGHNGTQASYTAGTNNDVSGTAALGSSPGIILGFSIASENLSSVPGTGTGNTSLATVWKWDQAQFNARVQYRNASSPGTAGSNFNALSSDFYQTLMVAFADAGAAPAPTPYVRGSGPGASPDKRFQFRAAPRGLIPPAVPTTAIAFAPGAVVGFTADLSSFRTSGGLAYISQPGPGTNGPFNNNQFQSAPRSVSSVAAPFLASFQSGAVWGFSLGISQLTPLAAAAGAVVSMTADLATQASSGGSVGYQWQPGPGANGPFNNNQFQSAPRSTKPGFQSLSGSFSASSQVSMSPSLATGIRMGMADSALPSVSMALTTNVNMALAASFAVNASGSLAAAARFAAIFGAQAQSSFDLAGGITFAGNFSGLTYMSAALGGTSLSVTAAGLVGTSLSLLTAIPMTASSAGNVSFSPSLSSGVTLSGGSSAVVSTSLSLGASSAFSVQPTGAVSASFALQTGIPFAVAPTGSTSASLALTNAPQLATQFGGIVGAGMVLTTQPAPYAFSANSQFALVAGFTAPISLGCQVGARLTGNFALMTVLQPPGEFADIRWVRAPRGGDVAYAEFFQAVGEQLWYGVNWEDWLASNWEANSSATVGQALRPTVPNGLEFVCITAGQTGAVEPIWATFAGGVTVDGTAMWQAQAVSSASLDDTISSSSFSAPVGVTLDSAQVQSLRSYLIIETPAAVVGTDYDVLCTIYTTGGQQKIAKLRIKVR